MALTGDSNSEKDNHVSREYSNNDIKLNNIPNDNSKEQQCSSSNNNNSNNYCIDMKNNNIKNSSNSNISTNVKEFEYIPDHMHYILSFRKQHRVKFYIFDWFLCILCCFIGAALFYFVPVRGRLFRLDDPDISYPLLPELVPFSHLIVYSLVIPFFIICVVSYVLTKNISDMHHAILGLLQSFSITLLLIAAFKCFVGGLRPNFLELCKPTPESIASVAGVGYNNIYYTKEICTASAYDINDGMSAYPSGHAGLSATTLAFCFLYLHAKLKTFHHRGHLLIFIFVASSIVCAGLVGISRVADYRHTFLNVLAGWCIGIITATCMYRLNYLEIVGNRSHIPIADYWHWTWNQDHDQNNNNNNNNDIEGYNSSDSFDLENQKNLHESSIPLKK